MVSLWRIAGDTPSHLPDDLTGTGAEIMGGRWNRLGIAVVYASTTRALACLETVIHLDAGARLPLDRYLVEITVPDEAWAARTVLDAARHVGWDAEPPGMTSLGWGSAWLASGETLLAAVPSVIVPEEVNVLVNPAHADIATARARTVRRWTYDARFGRQAPRSA